MRGNSKNLPKSFLLSMASKRVDSLNFRTTMGAVNYYDNLKSIGTCMEKASAARIGAYAFDPINHHPQTTLSHLRLKDHYIREDGSHTSMNDIAYKPILSQVSGSIGGKGWTPLYST